MFWNFHFVICIYFKFLQIFFYAFVNMIYLSMETWFVYVSPLKLKIKKKKGKINRNYKSQKIITIYRMRRKSKRLIEKQKRKDKRKKNFSTKAIDLKKKKKKGGLDRDPKRNGEDV